MDMKMKERAYKLLELRYNPYHDPSNGRFTNGGGGSGGVAIFVGRGQKGTKSYIVNKGKKQYKFDSDTYNKVRGLEVELKYANEMTRQFGNVKYGGTKKTRELYDTWSNEARRLQKEISGIYKKNTHEKEKHRQGNSQLLGQMKFL